MTARKVTAWATRLLRLPASDDKALALIARREGTTVAAVIRRAAKAEVLKSNSSV
mgnify:CR=1 FL=1